MGRVISYGEKTGYNDGDYLLMDNGGKLTLIRTLARCKRNDLAVIDTEGHEKAVREAVSRGVWVYGYK